LDTIIYYNVMFGLLYHAYEKVSVFAHLYNVLAVDPLNIILDPTISCQTFLRGRSSFLLLLVGMVYFSVNIVMAQLLLYLLEPAVRALSFPLDFTNRESKSI